MDNQGSEPGTSGSFPFLLPGEKVELTAEKTLDLFGNDTQDGPTGTLIVTNYKLCFKYDVPAPPSDYFEVSHGSILKFSKESRSAARGLSVVSLTTRDLRAESFGLPAAVSKELLSLLKKRANPQSASSTFSLSNRESFPSDGWHVYDMKTEFDRQGVPWDHWFISPVNEGYYFCDSYPRGLPIPSDMRGVNLDPISQFRSRCRIQVLTWYSRASDAVLCRCAQLNPIVVQDMVGMASIKCPEDQRMMSAIRKSTRAGSRLAVPEGPPVSGGIGKGALWVLDTSVRPSSQQAWSDQQNHYPDCEYEFLGLPASATVREAMNRVHALCTSTPPTDSRLRAQLEELRHIEALAALLRAANSVATHLDSGDSVVVQSPDGSDTAAQICSLAQLFLDPFFRTIRGFQALIEKDWLGFGYRFVMEKKAAGKQQEVMSSVFVQWIDCVWQVWQHHPAAFEFNERYLLTILDHVYACRFGTFVYGTEKERVSEKLATTTPSLWGFINANVSAFLNPFHSPQAMTASGSSASNTAAASSPSMLTAPDTVGALKFWSGLYLRHAARGASRRARAAVASKPPTVDLAGLGLVAPPIELASHTNIRHLRLAKNAIANLPLSLGPCLSSVTSLDLDGNWLAALSSGYFSLLAPRLAQLEELNLSGNGLSRLPDEFTQLTALRVLQLADNKLDRLPPLRMFSALVELSVASNQLTEPFPRDVLSLQHLRALDFSNNRYTTLPDELSRLTRLTALGFGGNPLLSLPDLQHMTSLRTLNLESTSVGTIPPALWDLTLLESLYLGGLNLSDLPAELGRLSSLQLLSLRNNSLTRLPTDLLMSLASLRFLDLARNKLTTSPIEIGQLVALTHLDLSGNQLESLSPAIGKLTNLHALHLSNNLRLEALPPSMGFLPLTELTLDGLRLKTPSKDIVAQGRPSVLAYLRDLLQGAEPCNRMKLMLVGQENVGKTSVLRCLMRRYKGVAGAKKYDISTISTDGIAIDGWTFQWAGADGKAPRVDMTIAAWDFAGQEIYYSTHQFFLSERSIYLVVWNAAQPEADSRVEFWLQSIHARARGAQIVMVGTHLDDRACSKDYVKATVAGLERKYRRRFPGIKAIHVVSCVTGKGVDKLRADIEAMAAQHESTGTLVPRSYARLEQLVLEERQKRLCPVASFKEFASMAAMNTITDDLSVRNAAVMLHNLGTIVHFEKDPTLRDLIILDPQWLTDVMSSVLTTKHTFGKDGRLRHNALGQIWREPRFPASLHSTLLHLLEKFEVFLRLHAPGEEPVYLIPYMLSEDRPAQFAQFWTPLDTGEICFGRRYQFDFIPRGLFGRVVVRVLRLVEPRLFWQFGLLVQHGASDRLLIELDPVAKTLDIHARGRTGKASELALSVIEVIESLVNDWYRIARHVFVHCTHCIEQHQAPFMFPHELVTSAAMQGRSTVQCGADPRNQVPVARLMPDIALSLAASKRIEYSALSILTQIGEGAFATVYKATLATEAVAVKRLKVGSGSGMEEISALKAFEEFCREIWIMGSLQHPNVLPLKGYTLEPCALITEFLEAGNLHDLVQDKTKPLDWPTRLLIARDVASGMAYLHGRSPPVLHRDLKSPNVLLAQVERRLVAKVADFGVAQAIFARSATGRVVQNPTWLAPEVMRGEEYSLQSDTYSFGVIAWELASRTTFFGECKFLSQIEEAVLAGRRPPFPPDTPEWYQRMTDAAWSAAPSMRPAFVDVRDLLSSRTTASTPASLETTVGNEVISKRSEKKAKKHRATTKTEEKPAIQASPSVEHVPVDLHLDSVAGDERASRSEKVIAPALLHAVKAASGPAITALGQVDSRVWAGNAEGRIQIIDCLSDKVVDTRTGHRGPVTSIVQVHTSVWTAAADGLRVWDTLSAKQLHQLQCVAPAYLLVVGQSVWCGVGFEVIIYSLKYQVIRRLHFELGPVTALVLMRTNVWMALGRILARIDAQSQAVTAYLQGHSLPINCVALSGSEVLSGSDDGVIRVWSAKSGHCLRQLVGHNNALRAVCSDSHYSWTAGKDGLSVWDELGVCVREFQDQKAAATLALLLVDADGLKEKRVYAGREDGSVLVYCGVRR